MSHKTDLQSNNTDLQAILDMILALGLVDVPKIKINFSIVCNGVVGEYQAEEGMTWAEWVESEYNTSRYFVDGTNIVTASYVYAVIGVAADVIIPNQ